MKYFKEDMLDPGDNPRIWIVHPNNYIQFYDINLGEFLPNAYNRENLIEKDINMIPHAVRFFSSDIDSHHLIPITKEEAFIEIL